MRTSPPSETPSPITTCGPKRTPSPIRTSSPRTSPGARSDGGILRAPRRVEPLLERGEHPHDAQARCAVRARGQPVADALDEVLALELQRLAIGNPGAPDVARARDVLAVGGDVLVEALVVDRDLALEVHVVEGGHPAGADDREPALLVRIEPRQVQ